MPKDNVARVDVHKSGGLFRVPRFKAMSLDEVVQWCAKVELAPNEFKERYCDLVPRGSDDWDFIEISKEDLAKVVGPTTKEAYEQYHSMARRYRYKEQH